MGKLINLIVIAVIAAVVSVTSYFVTQNVFAAPLCRQAAARQGWTYDHLQPPDLLISGQNRSASNVVRDPVCVFQDAQGGKQVASIRTLSKGALQDLLISLGLQIDLVFIAAAALIALLWGGVAGVFSQRARA